MPRQTKASGEDGPSFTQAEMRLVALCLMNMKNTPEIDFEAVAKAYPYGSGSVARTRFLQVKNHCKAYLAKAESPGDGKTVEAEQQCSPEKTVKKRKAPAADGQVIRKKKTVKGKKMEEEFPLSAASDDFCSTASGYDHETDEVVKKEEDDSKIDSSDTEVAYDTIKLEAAA